MVNCLTIAERSGEVGTLGSDILFIAVLPVEAVLDFDGSEVAGFVVVSGSISDVVQGEFVFTGDCDSGAGIGASSLVALVTVAVGVFLATERLDAISSSEKNWMFTVIFTVNWFRLPHRVAQRAPESVPVR